MRKTLEDSTNVSEILYTFNNQDILVLSSVQFSSVVQSCPTLCDPWTAAHQASLSISSSRSLLKPMSIESVMLSNHLILCHPLSSCLQSFPASGSFLRSWVFSNELALRIRWPKYWSFSLSINPSNEYSRLISFVMD